MQKIAACRQIEVDPAVNETGEKARPENMTPDRLNRVVDMILLWGMVALVVLVLVMFGFTVRCLWAH